MRPSWKRRRMRSLVKGLLLVAVFALVITEMVDVSSNPTGFVNTPYSRLFE